MRRRGEDTFRERQLQQITSKIKITDNITWVLFFNLVQQFFFRGLRTQRLYYLFVER